MKSISVVVPVMNEVGNIEPLTKRISEVFAKEKYDYEIHFICDPSNDGTEQQLTQLQKCYKNIRITFTAVRAGQAECIRIGYDLARASAVLTMDADFQDPPELIPTFLREWENGNLIVHSRRVDRSSDGWVYRSLMGAGYKILKKLTDGKVMNHVGDFRLVDQSVIGTFKSFGDPRPFWRAISNLDGIRSTVIEYDRPARMSGSTKYSSLIGSPSFATRGLASFSVRPLHWLQNLGVASSVTAGIFLLYIIASTLLSGAFPRGIPTLIFIVSFFFTIQFISTAIVATYLIVLVEQTRRRPNYFIKKTVSVENLNNGSLQ